MPHISIAFSKVFPEKIYSHENFMMKPKKKKNDVSSANKNGPISLSVRHIEL